MLSVLPPIPRRFRDWIDELTPDRASETLVDMAACRMAGDKLLVSEETYSAICRHIGAVVGRKE